MLLLLGLVTLGGAAFALSPSPSEPATGQTRQGRHRSRASERVAPFEERARTEAPDPGWAGDFWSHLTAALSSP